MHTANNKKRPLGRPVRRWENNIKMDLKKLAVDWCYLAQERIEWRAISNTVTGLPIP
jgi:hypothetical protein